MQIVLYVWYVLLQRLLLHGNEVNNLRSAVHHLPQSIDTLSLADNNIVDLNEVSQSPYYTHLTTILSKQYFVTKVCLNVLVNLMLLTFVITYKRDAG